MKTQENSVSNVISRFLCVVERPVSIDEIVEKASVLYGGPINYSTAQQVLGYMVRGKKARRVGRGLYAAIDWRSPEELAKELF